MTYDEYSTFCGPRALAALSGCARYTAAVELHCIQRQRGEIDAPATPGDDIARRLFARGFDVEPWRPDGKPRCSADEFRYQLRKLRREFNAAKFIEFIAETDPDGADRLKAHVEATANAMHRLAVEDWQFPGRWLICIHEHALAISDGRVIAGDLPHATTYGGDEIQAAFKVTRR